MPKSQKKKKNVSKGSQQKVNQNDPVFSRNQGKERATEPSFKWKPSTCQVSHREFVSGLVFNSSGAPFSLISAGRGFDGNPGSSTGFPWLSGIARGYEQYTFKRLEFELISQNSAT